MSWRFASSASLASSGLERQPGANIAKHTKLIIAPFARALPCKPTAFVVVIVSVLASKNRMPDWIVVIILGIIEGVTEFLPISSTGHLLLAQHYLKREFPDVFTAVIQSGAVLAVLLVFTDRLKKLFQTYREKASMDFLMKLGVAFLITAVGGLALKKSGFALEKNPVPVAWATLVGGVLILLIESVFRNRQPIDEIPWRVACLIGAAQLLAVIFPGASRSGTTILVALALGCSRPKATEFSFLLGVPTLLAAAAVETMSALRDETAVPWGLLLLGSVVAAVTAFISVRWLLAYIQTHTFAPFGWYRIFLGGAILGLVYFN